MSNDLISREMLLHTLEGWLKLNARVVPTKIGKAFYMMIADYPAVPQEMSAREFLVAYKRMCASFPETDCSKCPMYTPYKDCTDNPCDWDIDKILPAVGQWAREHPEERSEE